MLRILQKKAIRIIFSVKYNAHTSSLFDKSKITKVENIFEKESLITAYYFQNKILPNAIMDLFKDSLYDNNIITRQRQQQEQQDEEEEEEEEKQQQHQQQQQQQQQL